MRTLEARTTMTTLVQDAHEVDDGIAIAHYFRQSRLIELPRRCQPHAGKQLQVPIARKVAGRDCDIDALLGESRCQMTTDEARAADDADSPRDTAAIGHRECLML